MQKIGYTTTTGLTLKQMNKKAQEVTKHFINYKGFTKQLPFQIVSHLLKSTLNLVNQDQNDIA